MPETAPTESDLVRADVVVLTGVATDRGVLATARDAVYQGVMTIVVSDGVGSFSDEGNERGLQELGRISHVCSSAQIIEAWAR